MPRKPRNTPGPMDKKILEAIRYWWDTFGIPPTVREIQQYVKASSTSVVDYHLRQLEKWGYIAREGGRRGQRRARNIRLLKWPREVTPGGTEESLAAFQRRKVRATARHQAPVAAVSAETRPMATLPLAGRIVASAPIPSFPEGFTAEDTLEIPLALLPSDTSRLYALEVQGNSMIDALIGDGDIVVMQETKEAAPGELVAVWLKSTNESTLKKFQPVYDQEDRLQKVVLKPANPTMQPIEIDDIADIEIMGRVVLVIRRPGDKAWRPRMKV